MVTTPIIRVDGEFKKMLDEMAEELEPHMGRRPSAREITHGLAVFSRNTGLHKRITEKEKRRRSILGGLFDF